MNILAIETSCDETAAAVSRDGRTILSDVVYSQADMHALYGGVVPEIASRKHIEKISLVADQALAQSGLKRREIDAVAATCAPGLIGALLVGANFAKACAQALGKPCIPVHHIRGHIAANYVAFPQLKPPFLALVVSGGHTILADVEDYAQIELLGTSRAVAQATVPKAMEAARQRGRKVVAAAGGVAANSVLRAMLEKECQKQGVALYLPPLSLCGDNGSMIACQAYYEYLAGNTAGLEQNCYATMPVSEAVVAKSDDENKSKCGER